MPDERKVVMGDAYKEALEQKKADSLRNQANELAKEKERKQREAIAKKRLFSKKQQQVVDQKKAEVAHFRTKLKKAEKIATDGSYKVLAMGSLGFSILLLVTDAIIYLRHSGSRLMMVGILVFALVALWFSICVQSMIMGAENEIREYTPRLWAAKEELQKLLSKYRR